MEENRGGNERDNLNFVTEDSSKCIQDGYEISIPPIRLIPMFKETEDPRECYPLDTWWDISENAEDEDPPRKIHQSSSFSCEIHYDTELHYAVRKNDLSSLRDILSWEPSVVDLKDGHGFTALHIAALVGGKEIVQVLLKAGANTKIQDSCYHQTPLHLALCYNQIHAAEVLVNWDAGGRPNDLQDYRGRTPLGIAASNGFTEIVKKLVAAGANTHLSDVKGKTPLHAAIYSKNEDTAEFLVVSGSVNDLQDNSGRSPLHLAASRGHAELCRKLLAAGCNARLQDYEGSSPLHVALIEGTETVALVLAFLDCENDLQDAQGMTPLNLACSRGYVRVVKKLLSAYADTQLRDNSGDTPLYTALVNGHELVAEILIDSGTEYELQSEDGQALLHIATVLEYERVVRKLLFYGVHPHAKDKEGEYPLQSALKCTNKKILNMFLSACSLKDVALNFKELDLKPDVIQSCIKLQSECYAEIQQMRSTMIPGTILSYHDLAKRPISKVAWYLDNELVQLYCDTTILPTYCENIMKEDFPNYAELISLKVTRAERRKFLTDHCQDYFVLLSRKFPSLPSLAIDIILSCLGNRDLKKICSLIQIQVLREFFQK